MMVGWGSRRSEAILRTHIPGVKILESKMDEARLLLDCLYTIYVLLFVKIFIQHIRVCLVRDTIGVVAEWLSRKTRNLVPSGASVRIWPTSTLF